MGSHRCGLRRSAPRHGHVAALRRGGGDVAAAAQGPAGVAGPSGCGDGAGPGGCSGGAGPAPSSGGVHVHGRGSRQGRVEESAAVHPQRLGGRLLGPSAHPPAAAAAGSAAAACDSQQRAARRGPQPGGCTDPPAARCRRWPALVAAVARPRCRGP
ncbi:hypothetical protein CHLRE_02g101786v5 [Chlamydomonas reinhardtii]|uniref:Uncharacterized protein n=1 Tax=Chlamydomonas reinhardtii TaxID=3055 RepID=A0A2K3E2B7_CHLRE|nr:uncharacterized protein CHLRE_02g101786v5 [Chlamydomonas reinhardtii]PNW86930.1 hypothetical protein CHLRE_02g101786v5 [Chlamydomonas reinhardtii]